VLCIDKASGSAVGTAHFQTNAGGPLLIEHSVSLPEAMRSDTRAEITRLSAIAGADPLVKLSLMKASYLFCMATQIRWMVIGARNEALVRQYRMLGFKDVFDDDRMVPLRHAGRLDHRVLAFTVIAAERTWREPRHQLYEFIFETSHPDIQLFSKEPALPGRQAGRPAHMPLSWIASAVALPSCPSGWGLIPRWSTDLSAAEAFERAQVFAFAQRQPGTHDPAELVVAERLTEGIIHARGDGAAAVSSSMMAERAMIGTISRPMASS